jgi:hypothetical protein
MTSQTHKRGPTLNLDTKSDQRPNLADSRANPPLTKYFEGNTLTLE